MILLALLIPVVSLSIFFGIGCILSEAISDFVEKNIPKSSGKKEDYERRENIQVVLTIVLVITIVTVCVVSYIKSVIWQVKGTAFLRYPFFSKKRGTSKNSDCSQYLNYLDQTTILLYNSMVFKEGE